MIDKEISIEQVSFTCRGCGHSWSVDYRVEHVEDGHGHSNDYYLRNGLPVLNPNGNRAVTCPSCGRDTIAAHPAPRRPLG